MNNNNNCSLKLIDNEIFSIIKKENLRQENHIELIASENYTSLASMEAQGSILTNKYAEGYIGNRYYGGCKFIDKIEKLAINRVKKIFSAEAANVQPHSGSQANQSVFFSILNPGDVIMGMSLTHGGHLTHGLKVNLSGKWFKVVSYGLNEKEEIDYDLLKKTAIKNNPKLIIAGSSAYSLYIDFKYISNIAKKVGAFFMVDMAHYAGLIAAGLYPNPIPYSDFITSTTHKSLRGPRGGFILMKSCFEKKINSSVFPGIQGGPLMHVIAAKAVCFKEALSNNFKLYQKQVVKNADLLANLLLKKGFKIVSGGTKSHLILLDLSDKNLSGKQAENILSKVNIICNKNLIPNDKNKPWITSGIRLGTLAITTRGFKEPEIFKLADFICDSLNNFNNLSILNDIKFKVKALINNFPIYK